MLYHGIVIYYQSEEEDQKTPISSWLFSLQIHMEMYWQGLNCIMLAFLS